MVEVKPYGAWPSPITAESLSEGSVAYDTCVDNGYIYWCQTISQEKGRGQIFKQLIKDNSQPPQPLLPAEYDCATRVHEYGRGSFKVSKGLVIFSNSSDSRLYTIVNDEITPLTEADKLYRYADLAIDPENRYLICVREEHFENEEPKDVVNVLVSIDLKTKKETVIAEGEDFYSSPQLYNNELVYVCWSHPNMPWDYTRIYRATLTEQLTLKDVVCVAGDKIDESISVSPVITFYVTEKAKLFFLATYFQYRWNFVLCLGSYRLLEFLFVQWQRY